ncbi:MULTISPECIES: FAD-dependent oxidoreductase [unclassified Cobetia]|uniref:FAD-dependent oxidoreductase n=1 Tax=unclassified Cobetia TaxID=2609414 RepID=UPI002097B5F7|nr:MULTISPECIES: FAD-dependent oxidoreductase [unclassified Cobetia]MCO7233494.1 NAD(P)-binding domain-containing protein [Cobetia sp. Dlab-2-AX]MCO7236770.1 NAD(P)-binding domain-containing protein [Cobetia sp. Dlab-2-U]
MSRDITSLPVVIIGAGPIGLSAAVNLLEAGLEPILFESGAYAGANLASWSHVRMFSPWSWNIDALAAELLQEQGWRAPDVAAYPTGAEFLDRYVAPLAAHPSISSRLHVDNRVTHVSRQQHDVLRNGGRDEAPFVLRVEGPDGPRDVLARAVIDASGTYQTPNWIGAHGIPAIGEQAAAEVIAYGVPDIRGTQATEYAGKSVLVIGSGHSALNALQDLIALEDHEEGMRIVWGVRCAKIEEVIRPAPNDELEERKALELRIKALLEEGRIEVVTGLAVEAIEHQAGRWVVKSGEHQLPAVDRIIAATGFRPSLGLLSELRVSLDPATQSPIKLAPLIDPNQHSCGSVPQHGAAELLHAEPGLFILGIKSYGRAPTFLMRTGYQQVRSVVAALADPASIRPAPVCNAPATRNACSAPA